MGDALCGGTRVGKGKAKGHAKARPRGSHKEPTTAQVDSSLRDVGYILISFLIVALRMTNFYVHLFLYVYRVLGT